MGIYINNTNIMLCGTVTRNGCVNSIECSYHIIIVTQCCGSKLLGRILTLVGIHTYIVHTMKASVGAVAQA